MYYWKLLIDTKSITGWGRSPLHCFQHAMNLLFEEGITSPFSFSVTHREEEVVRPPKDVDEAITSFLRRRKVAFQRRDLIDFLSQWDLALKPKRLSKLLQKRWYAGDISKSGPSVWNSLLTSGTYQ